MRLSSAARYFAPIRQNSPPAGFPAGGERLCCWFLSLGQQPRGLRAHGPDHFAQIFRNAGDASRLGHGHGGAGVADAAVLAAGAGAGEALRGADARQLTPGFTEGLVLQLDARLRHHAAGCQPAVPRHPERGVSRAAGDRAVYGVDAVLVQTGGRGDAAQDVLQEAGEVLLAALQAVALHVIVRRFRRGEAVVSSDHGRVAAQRGDI